MKSFIDLVVTQVFLFSRRISFLIYVVLMLVLAAFVSLTDNLSGGTGALVVRVSNNLLFFQVPFLALLVSPLVVQNQGQSKDWLWTTPLKLPLLVLSQFVGVALVLCVSLALNGFLVLVLLALLGRVPAGSLVSLFGYYLVLLLPVTVTAASTVIGLALSVRNTLAVTAIAAGVSALAWLGILMPTATILTPLNFSLLTLDLNPVAGMGAERPLLLSLLLFYLSCIPPILILATAAHTRLDRRTGWSPKGKHGLAGLTLLTFVATGWAWQYYSVTVARRLVPPPIAEQIEVWEVVDIEQKAALEMQVLQVRTTMRLRNRSGEAQSFIELGLNPGLHVTDASAAGEIVSSQRIGELIQLGPLPSKVAAGENIELKLLYGGVPKLLREDYQLGSTIREDDSVSFQQAYVSYVDRNALQWMRDSDWLAWPLAPGPHVASKEHNLQISLDDSDSPFLSSGTINAQTGGIIAYEWDSPPQFLIARGVQKHTSIADGDIWVGKLSTERTTATARRLLQQRRALGEWLEGSATHAYHVVELPYIQELVMGGLILGFSNEIDSRFPSLSTSVTTSVSSTGTPPEVKTVHAPATALELTLAIEVSRAWLSDKIRWPKNELIKSGNLRSYSVACERPNEAGNENCRLGTTGGINRQAPGGRWIEEEESQSAVAPLLQAFAVVVAHELVLSVTGNQNFFEEELSKWKGVILIYLEGHANTSSLIPPFLPQERHPIGTMDKRHNCQLAHFVVALSEFASQFGRDALADLITSLAHRYPPGSEFLSEEMTRQILLDNFNYDWRLSESICRSA